MLYCPFCNASNRDGSRYCNACGRNLAAVLSCPACRASNPPDAQFCSICGARVRPLAVPRPSSVPPAVDAARFVDERELPSLEADVDESGSAEPVAGRLGRAEVVTLTREDLSIVEWYDAFSPVPAPLSAAASPPSAGFAPRTWSPPAWLAEPEVAVTSSPPPVERALPDWLFLPEAEIQPRMLPDWLFLPEPEAEATPARSLPDWLFLAEPAAPPHAPSAEESPTRQPPPAEPTSGTEAAEMEPAAAIEAAPPQKPPPVLEQPITVPAEPPVAEPALPSTLVEAPVAEAIPAGVVIPPAGERPGVVQPGTPTGFDYGGAWSFVSRMRLQMAEAERLQARQAELAASEGKAPMAEAAPVFGKPRRSGFLSRLFKRSRAERQIKGPQPLGPVKPLPGRREPHRSLWSRLFGRRKG